MRTIPGRPSSVGPCRVGGVAARLLAAGALLALGACAEAGDPPRPMASISPLELVGLSVQSAEADRILGTVEDVVVTPSREPVQILVASGAPVYPLKRRVAVDTGNLRYSSERQALMLTGMSPDQFAALPPIAGNGQPAPLPGTTDATNWYRATNPGPR
ncbi:hypothetical protein [Azospirillum canadense]|uniref:hypothetical protein n=1 Tax=Azospirillum canadense TaxID=403962 RepID=UPI002227C85C|nr:hypothetical protein [Azospirillum canadense]MCW2243207.1 hypothetical protein [Azospirillum canadense]